MIELTQMVIPSPKKFCDVLFTFNNKEDHGFDDRLKRVNLSRGKFRKALYPMMIEVKKNHFKTGTYGFIFNEFTVIANWHNNHLHTVTFLKRQWRNNMKDLKVKFKKRIYGFTK